MFTFETDYYCICVECGGRAQCHGMCVEVQGPLWSHPLFRLYMGSRGQTQTIGLVQQVLLPAVHLDPFICFSNPPMNRHGRGTQKQLLAVGRAAIGFCQQWCLTPHRAIITADNVTLVMEKLTL